MAQPGAQNGIVGDTASPIEEPHTVIPEVELTRETEMASFAKGKEFEILKSVFAQRIEYYKAWVPSGNNATEGTSIQDLTNEERGWRWLAADLVIRELSSVVAAYEQAAQGVASVEQ